MLPTILISIIAIVETYLLNKYFLLANKYKRQKEMAMKQFQNLSSVFDQVCRKHNDSILNYTSEVFGNHVKVK